MRRLTNILAFWLLASALTGCVAAPASNDELAQQGALERTSGAGLARGRLTVLGNVEEGSNDFELELTPAAPGKLATLDSVVAVMPSHGHRAEPAQIEATDTGYHIVDLRLTMSGVWQLHSELLVDGRSDELSFEIDVP